MYLKSLTLKGFKSFADPTSLDLEPGVTVVVGPNGSGKSNVVDAISWVLGAQGPRVVRSAKMDDVIFAGTEKRAALGRAEVSLTIDNTSRRLPIEFNEVTITRTLFRSGESEYALNGVACRLLDIQELLSDSGVGRQQHVIVSQGQLDVVLAQRPEDRRMILEEAAGVLKFRRRRERAERRLETSEAALQRLTDLLREVHRQIRPLERQAASAVRHEQLDAELRALRLYLFGRELIALEARRAAIEDETRHREARAHELAAELDSLGAVLARTTEDLELARNEALPLALGRAQRLTERARGLLAVCEERRRAHDELAEVLASGASADDLAAELERCVSELDHLEAELETLRVSERELAQREAHVRAAEDEHARRFGEPSEEPPVELVTVRSEHARARDDHSRANEAAARTAEKLAAIERELGDNTGRLAEVETALAAVGQRLGALTGERSSARRAEEEAVAAAAAAGIALEEARARRHEHEARVSTLEAALDEARARSGLERLGDQPGVLGTVLDVLDPPDELVAAVSAALEAILDAVVVGAETAAVAAIRELREHAGGGAVVMVNGASDERSAPAPAGLSWLAAHLGRGDARTAGFANLVLGDVALCSGGFDAALAAAQRHPDLTIVTPDGDRFAPRAWRVGLRTNGTSPAAISSARASLADALVALESASARSRSCDASRDAARAEASALDQDHARLEAEQRHLEADHERATRRHDELIGALGTARAALAGTEAAAAELAGSLARVEGRLFALEEIGQAHLERTNERLESHRALEERRGALGRERHELEVRLAALGERQAMLGERELELRAAIVRHDEQLERARAEASDASLGTDLVAVASRLDRLLAALDGLGTRLSAVAARRSARQRDLVSAIEEQRARRSRLEDELDAGRTIRQRLEVELAEVRVRREAALVSLGRDLGASLEEATQANVPELAAGEDPADRAAALEAELVTLGPVNPLAREELAALEERSSFLETQLADVRSARQELHQIIRAVDAEIVDVFTATFSDVEAHFAELFELLFPGGQGRLVLTDPEDLLRTGVDIEARPAGRNVRRLSLLSGGERSLTALAFLFAVFRSRPSPFYVLDEVEAALDEVNLRRFLTLLEEFRDEAQLIVVSHQKKTMEIADALYGVTMQPGGASRVVSERVARDDLRRELAAP